MTDLLRRAAKLMRQQHGPEHVRHDFWSATADLLDAEAQRVERHNRMADFGFGDDAPDFYRVPSDGFLAVARAYLGEKP